VCERER
jgi:hypothetical protein